MARGEWTHAAASRVRLDDYAWAWLEGRRVRGRPLAPRTVDSYRHSLGHWILPALGPLTLDLLTPGKIRSWHTAVSGKTGPTATRQEYCVLRAILNTAVEDELLSRNPCEIRGGVSRPAPSDLSLTQPPSISRRRRCHPTSKP